MELQEQKRHDKKALYDIAMSAITRLERDQLADILEHLTFCVKGALIQEGPTEFLDGVMRITISDFQQCLNRDFDMDDLEIGCTEKELWDAHGNVKAFVEKKYPVFPQKVNS